MPFRSDPFAFFRGLQVLAGTRIISFDKDAHGGVRVTYTLCFSPEEYTQPRRRRSYTAWRDGTCFVKTVAKGLQASNFSRRVVAVRRHGAKSVPDVDGRKYS